MKRDFFQHIGDGLYYKPSSETYVSQTQQNTNIVRDHKFILLGTG